VSDIPIAPAPVSVVPAQAGSPAPPGGPDRSAIIRGCFLKVGKSGAAFLDRILQNKAIEATGDKSYAAELVAATTATKEEIEAFADLGEIILKELKLDLRFLPIIAAGTIMAGGAMRYGVAIKGVQDLLKQKRAKENPQTPKP
jgi:hypothetical protein